MSGIPIPDCEEILSGGAQTAGLVRTGASTRRPAFPRSDYVERVLLHLESVGFDGAPRFVGYDDQGRQVLSYVPGAARHSTPHLLSDSALSSCAELVRRFHDATAGSELSEGCEVVCHGDLGPHNMVFRDDRAVALIDFDGGVRPGTRTDDFSHAVWCCADLAEPSVPVDDQLRRAHLMCRAYPGMSPATVVAGLTARWERARASAEGAGRDAGVAAFDSLLRWAHDVTPVLAAQR